LQWSTCNLCCYKQIWWTSLSECNSWAGALWAYTVLRMVLWFDASWITYTYSSSFDKRKKGIRAEPLYEKFKGMPATVFHHYAFELPSLIVNIFESCNCNQ
jgi:hypothetical protein